MGRLHARAVARRASAVGDCALAGVTDRHAARSERVASEFASTALPLEQAIAAAEAAIVAVPTSEHAGVASTLLSRGLDLLVEKPMTGTASGARPLLALARRTDRMLAVGHVEWWNPVWSRVLEAAGKPSRIRVQRLHPPTDRGLDIDVVQDFMVHDLDAVRRRWGAAATLVEASGRRVSNARLDEARVVLAFEGGPQVELAASRVHAKRCRTIEVEGAAGSASGDLDSGSVAGWEGDLETGSVAGPEGDVGDREPDSSGLCEPLDLQLADFVRACVARDRPVNDAEEGVATLELVDRVRAAIGEGA